MPTPGSLELLERAPLSLFVIEFVIVYEEMFHCSRCSWTSCNEHRVTPASYILLLPEPSLRSNMCFVYDFIWTKTLAFVHERTVSTQIIGRRDDIFDSIMNPGVA